MSRCWKGFPKEKGVEKRGLSLVGRGGTGVPAGAGKPGKLNGGTAPVSLWAGASGAPKENPEPGGWVSGDPPNEKAGGDVAAPKEKPDETGWEAAPKENPEEAGWAGPGGWTRGDPPKEKAGDGDCAVGGPSWAKEKPGGGGKPPGAPNEELYGSRPPELERPKEKVSESAVTKISKEVFWTF